jgi:RNA polymerase sigma-70 factor (ECF subfamily)
MPTSDARRETGDEAVSHDVVDSEQLFLDMYRELFAFVWRILRRLGVPDEQLEDATQEVFLVAYRRRARYRSRVSPRSWLFGIARRVAADARRRERRTRRRLQAVSSWAAAARPVRETARQEASHMVRRLLEQLPEPKRMVFILAEVEGMTAPEIADALGIKINTVYSRVRTAREAFLRAAAEQGENDDG